MVMSNRLERGIQAFDTMLPTLRQNFGPVWTVFVGADLKGKFEDFEQAAKFVVAHFADDDVLIRHTDQHVPHIPFVAVDS